MLWQRAIFSVGLCIHRQHCAVNWIKVGKIIRGLRLPQFAVRHVTIPLNVSSSSPAHNRIRTNPCTDGFYGVMPFL